MSSNNSHLNIDSIFYSVVLIKSRVGGRGPNPCEVMSSTGFFFETNQRKYLITNRHVVIKEIKNFYPDELLIKVHTSKTSNIPNREIEIALYDSENSSIWLEHPNQEIDVVAIPVDSYLRQEDRIHTFTPKDSLPPNIFLCAQEKCSVIGYPMAFHDEMHNLPILLSASIASAYGAFFDGNRYFLIDSPNLHPGTSGSPVVLPASAAVRRMLGKKGEDVGIGLFPTYLLGIHSGEYDGLGLNVVWYADLLKEIIV